MARPGIRGLAGTEVESMVTAFVSRIYEHFENVSDPRVNRGGNYPVLEMVFVVRTVIRNRTNRVAEGPPSIKITLPGEANTHSPNSSFFIGQINRHRLRVWLQLRKRSTNSDRPTD